MSPSISLLVLAALTPAEHSVYIEDENTGEINTDDNPDFVGITVNVDTSVRAYKIASIYRKKGIAVIFGGIHASALPDEVLKYADSVCIGEAENVWQQIVYDVIKNRLQKKYYSASPADLSKTPIPKWELINKSKYLYCNIICASRGCPFQCEFCYNSCDYVHNKYRARPIDNVIEEIKNLKTRHVMFIDDNFIGNPKWTKELLQKTQALQLTWHAAVSTNIGSNMELLDQMKDTGCKSLFIGFESINKKSIGSVNKFQNNIADYEKLINELHNRGIMINASMVFGFDHDYPDVFENTLNWLVANKVETMTAHILTPYPGTKFYYQLQSQGRILDSLYTRYNTSNVVFKPQNMTCEELYNGYLWIYNQFYSLKNIIRRFPESERSRIAYLLFNLGYRKFGKITSKLGQLGLMNKIGSLARRIAYGVQ